MTTENNELARGETPATVVLDDPALSAESAPVSPTLKLPDEVFKFEYLIGNSENELAKGLYTFAIRVPRTLEEFNSHFGSYYVPLTVGEYRVSVPVILNEDEVSKYGLILTQRAVKAWAQSLCKLNNVGDYNLQIGSISRVTSTIIKEWANFVDPIYHELERIVDGAQFTISNCYQTLTAPNSAYTKFLEMAIEDYLAGPTLVDEPEAVITKTFDSIVSDTETELLENK